MLNARTAISHSAKTAAKTPSTGPLRLIHPPSRPGAAGEWDNSSTVVIIAASLIYRGDACVASVRNLKPGNSTYCR